MFPRNNLPLEDMMKPGREAFEYWISFFPTAPLFGVQWRFEGMMPMPGMMGDLTKPTPKKPVATKVAPAPAAATDAKPAAKAAPVAKAAPKPAAAKPAPKPAPVAKAAVETVAPMKAPAPKAASQKAPANKAPAKKAPPKKAAAVAAKPKDGRPAALLTAKPSKVDDLKLIKGIGPGLEKELNGLGVYQFEQMAGFKKADLKWIDDNLTAFKGRCFRDDWTGQAKALMA